MEVNTLSAEISIAQQDMKGCMDSRLGSTFILILFKMVNTWPIYQP